MDKFHCPVCEEPLDEWADTSEWGNMESTSECVNGCKLYHYQHSYGAYRETIGFGYQDWSYRDTNFQEIQNTRLTFTDETRELWRREDTRPFLKGFGEEGVKFNIAALADLLIDLDICPATVAAIKEWVEGEEAARANH